MEHINTTLFILVILLSSCINHKELVNFNEAKLPADTPVPVLNALQLRVEPDDLLRINVHSIDPVAAAPFNIERQSTGNTQGIDFNSLELFSGYLVDREGYIDFPLLGRLMVKGMNLEEIKNLIHGKLKVYLKDPVVSARYLNFKITVLGEVSTPGIIRLTNSRVTLLDALGHAGDLTLYADRSDILLVREGEETRVFKHIDLRREDFFNDPYFYLKQNDVVYVKPIKAKTATVSDPGQRLISYGSALLSFVTLIFAFTRD